MSLNVWGGSGVGVWGDTAVATDVVQTYTEVVYSYFEVGYLLATNPFGDNYKLVRLEIEDVVVYDAEVGSTSQVGFRFYDGTQTVADPIIKKYVTQNPGAHFGDILLFLPVAEYTRPPRVRAVISNIATVSGDNETTLSHISLPAPTTFWEAHRGYDHTTGTLYVFYWGDFDFVDPTDHTLIVFSVDKGREVSRVVWGGQENPYGFVALAGSGYFVCAAELDSVAPFPVAIINGQTGEQVAVETTNGPFSGLPLPKVSVNANHVRPGVWLVYGPYSWVHNSETEPNSFLAVCDVNSKTVEIIQSNVCPDYWTMCCPGRRRTGTASFFVAHWTFGQSQKFSHLVKEVVWDGTDVLEEHNVVEFGTSTIIDGIAYDPQTGYLVVPTSNAGVYTVMVVNPKDGSVVSTISSSVRLTMYNPDTYQSNQHFAKPGHVVLLSDSSKKFYDLDLSSLVLTEWATSVPTDLFENTVDLSRDLMVVPDYIDPDERWTRVRVGLLSDTEVTLQSAITQIMSLRGYTPGDLVFEGFTADHKMVGYTIAKDSRTSDLLQTLADIYDFSFCDTGVGYFFKKIAKTGTIVADGTVSELVKQEGGSIVTYDKADSQKIHLLDFKYVSKDNAYQSNNVSESRPSAYFEVTESTRRESVDAPIVNYDATMQELVTQRLYQSIVGSRNHTLVTVPDFAHFLPGDSVDVTSLDQVFSTQLTGVVIGRDLSVMLESIDISADVQVTVSSVSNVPVSPTMPTTFATQFLHMDVPLLDYSHDGAGVVLVDYGVLHGQDNWLGGGLFAGEDLSLIYTQPPEPIVIGYATSVLAAPPELWLRDDVNSLTISLEVGEETDLASASEASVLYGANLAFLGQAGRWEGLGFETVVDNGDGTVTLSNFTFRGWSGTEAHAYEHQVGDKFVLADAGWMRRLETPVAELGDSWLYKAVGTGSSIAGTPTLSTSSQGVAETPYAPVNLTAVVNGSDIDLDWDFRSRLSGWEFFTATPDSGEATESYEVDIMNGASVVHTLAVSTSEAKYLDADIVADFGSMPASLTFRVYQMSAVVGRGRVAEATRTL